MFANSEYHGGVTLRADGGHYDALLNRLVAPDAQAWSDDVGGVVYEDITWWDRYGDEVSDIAIVAIVAVGVAEGVMQVRHPWRQHMIWLRRILRRLEMSDIVFLGPFVGCSRPSPVIDDPRRPLQMQGFSYAQPKRWMTGGPHNHS